MAALTKAQEKQAWRYLMTLDNNTDKDIAKLMGLPVGPVRKALADLEKKKMARINKRVNKRYEERKEAERFYAEQNRKMDILKRKGKMLLAGPGDNIGQGKQVGQDN